MTILVCSVIADSNVITLPVLRYTECFECGSVTVEPGRVGALSEEERGEADVA
jgi:hypothetical protein